MQKVAAEEGDEKIDYLFVDDTHQILTDLIATYKKASFLVPNGVMPLFYHYAGWKIELCSQWNWPDGGEPRSIVGTGERRGDYRQKMFHMLECAKINRYDYSEKFNLAETYRYGSEEQLEALKQVFTLNESLSASKEELPANNVSIVTMSIFRPEKAVVAQANTVEKAIEPQ